MNEVRSPSLVERYALPAAEIEPRSFAIIDGLLPGGPSSVRSDAEWQVVRRVVHTTGDPTLAGLLRLHPEAVAAGVAAVRAGADVVTDVRMVAAGISRGLLARWGGSVRCAIAAPEAAERARADGTTRAVAAMRWLAGQRRPDGRSSLEGSIVAVGNAPTALLALLDLIDAGAVRPALIVGVPVGFVAAAESKAELMERGVPYITLPGTRGGSTIAVAAVNAILRLACAVDGSAE